MDNSFHQQHYRCRHLSTSTTLPPFLHHLQPPPPPATMINNLSITFDNYDHPTSSPIWLCHHSSSSSRVPLLRAFNHFLRLCHHSSSSSRVPLIPPCIQPLPPLIQWPPPLATFYPSHDHIKVTNLSIATTFATTTITSLSPTSLATGHDDHHLSPHHHMQKLPLHPTNLLKH